jgi:hypothetical protein
MKGDSMFETNDEITAAVETVYSLTVKLNRGEILTHESVSGVLGLCPHEGRWNHIMRKVARQILHERGIEIRGEIGVGYKLLTSVEQLQSPSWRSLRALRQVRRGRKAVRFLPEKGLTVHQRRQRLFGIDRSLEMERSLRQEIKAHAEIAKPTVVTPRRPSLTTTGANPS